MSEIFNALEQQTSLKFTYNHIKIDENLVIEINANKQSLREVLEEISKNTQLTFRRVNENVHVAKATRRQEPVVEFFREEQSVSINGRVTSPDSPDGLPGVNVVLKGTGQGTVTDINGNYTITVPGSESILVFSSVGYLTEEVTVGSRSVINIYLSSDVTALQEIVVTALGIERDKRSLGYSVGEVKGSEVGIVGQENMLAGLAARVPGVTVNQISGAGSSVSVTIRGINSLTTDNQPLFVVDGVPMNNSLNNFRRYGDRNEIDYGNAISDINPEDIESISVLKGPSAAALYGSRAGNGVILITTKKGSKEKMTVSFSTNTVFERPVKYLDFQYEYASGDRSGLNERAEYWNGLSLDKGVTAVQWNSPRDANGNRLPTELRSYPDNMKNFLQTGITSTNSIAVGGSSDKANYRFSYTNMSHQGMIPNSDLFRHNVTTNADFKLSDKVTVSTSVNFVRSKSNDRPSTGNRGGNAPEMALAWPHVDVRELKDYWLPGQEQIQQRTPADNLDNPYFIAYGITNAFTRDRVFGNVKLDYKISDNFSAFARITQDSYAENRETKIPFSYTRARQGAYHLEDQARNESNADFMFTFNKEITSDFNLSISAGGNYMVQTYREKYIGSQGNPGLIVPGLFNVNNIPINGRAVSNYRMQRAIYSLYSTASLGFKDQVYLDLTARNDWSSTLPRDNMSFFYPAASLSWLANYAFNLPQSISLLKLRAGAAQVGLEASPYQLQQILNFSQLGSLVTANLPGTLLNPTLKPELATSIEYGLDFNMFNNRLRFEGTYFNMQNENQILRLGTPPSSGFTQRDINAGLLESKGWELLIGGTPIKSKNGWNLDISANFARFRTKIVELADGIDFVTLWEDNNGGAQTYVGEYIGDLYSRGFAFVDDPNSPYYRWPILDAGFKQWIPNNDRAARVKVGNFNPDMLIGFQTTLSYKRWTLNANFDARIGGQFQSFTYRYAGSNYKDGRQKRMLIPGSLYSDEELRALLKSDPEKYIIPRNGWFPRVGGYSPEEGGYMTNGGGIVLDDGGFVPGVYVGPDGQYVENLGGPGTLYLSMWRIFPWSYNQQVTFDADFLKMRELSIGYDIPKFGGFRNANISVYTRNVILWTAAGIGIDPERAFQVQGNRQGDSVNLFRQGIELQNVLPWTVPFGFRLNFTF
ncbi:MAG: SusC/RagA family TonB-linked outer membrane protein [Cyclobacteriaceae bacterium]|nr:SusC/RagA family TonB-linked outer membrane protein [Cyclobacteriaceae bacterium]